MSVGHGYGNGKLILLGEHGVVYGRPALAASLPRAAEASAEPAARPALEVDTWKVAFDADAVQAGEQAEQLRHAFCALLDTYGERPALRVRARMLLPDSAGLGGSAALSVAIIRAIDDALGVQRDGTAVADAALAAERVFHGTPSGIDTTMSASSGVAQFRKGAPLEQLALARKLTFVVGHSGEPGRTLHTVASIRRQHERDPRKVDQVFDSMEALVANGKSALASGELWRFGQLMVLNQKLLAGLLVSTARLEEMCQVAIAAGALGAKLTGGGGGGCMIALCESAAQAEAVQAAIVALGRNAFIAEVSA
jgi:mevalonate kinase